MANSEQKMLSYLRLLVFLVAANIASIGAAETWKVGSQEDFVPFNYVENGKYVGIDVEILHTAVDAIGVTLDHRPTSWRRALLDFGAGKLDAIFQLTPTPERFDNWHMVGPLRTTQTVFMTRANSAVDDIHDLSDLSGLIVGAVAGYTYGHAFDNDDTIFKEPSVDDFTNVRKLLLGRSDIVVGGFETLKYVVNELNAQDKVRFLATPLVVRDRYIAFQRTPDGYAKAQRLQEQLDLMHSEGIIPEIIQSFLQK